MSRFHIPASIDESPAAAQPMLQAVKKQLGVVPNLFRLVGNSPAALEGYLDATSSALFSLAARVMAPTSEAIDHLARHAGLAQGMVQAIATLPLDAARRQLFVPLQLLESHGSGIEEVFAGKQTPKARGAIDQLIGEADEHLKTALSLLPRVPPEVRPVFLPLAVVRGDLKRMSRADSDPFVVRVTPRLRILWTLWRASRSKAFNSQAFNAG